MRLGDPITLQTLALYALAPVTALLGLGVAAALVATALVAAAGLALRQRRVMSPPADSTLELHTITYSHYVEKVRWCLDATGIPYRELPSIGILGLLLTGRTVPMLVVPAARSTICESSQILRYLWGAWSATLPAAGLLAPSPERLALEKHFDEELGINVRLWSYWHLLEQPDLTLLMWGIDEPQIPGWQRGILPYIRFPLATMLRRALGVSGPRAKEGLEATRRVFAEVDAMLSDGRRYLEAGPEKTFVDITFASLAALALFPEGYAGSAASMRRLPLDRLTPAWREEVEALRATAAGRFALRLYAEER
ncbi:MAG TPA: glutathione S-transferase N-terminal domain-containing protein [Candidatus Binatia bacterium]|jgi:glutathione S-transferase